jgi:hypothetical protein
MHLVLLESSGNQAFLFATNRLRENIGASELTYRAGTEFVLEAVEGLTAKRLWSANPQTLRENLCHEGLNPAIQEGTGVEVIVATSGKALLLVDSQDTGQAIVAEATRRALREAPGLDLCGVVSRDFSWHEASIHEEVKAVYQLFEEVRRRRAQPLARFPTLPICLPCKSSGLPAAALDAEGEPVSWTSLSKRQRTPDWQSRISQILRGSGLFVFKEVIALEEAIKALEKDYSELDWLAVVHADGNGLGKIFLEFERYLSDHDDPNRHYINQLREFSIALEEATEAAFIRALDAFPPLQRRGKHKNPYILPIVPLVLGGDDLTVICAGRYALEFTRRYLHAFEQETADTQRRHGIIPAISARALACPHLSACAGVAIIKPHFPFHSAYTLAEELLKSAKLVKRRVRQLKADAPHPCSALDFHVLYDASFSSLEAIRRQLCISSETTLTAKPYVTTPTEDLKDIAESSWEWLQRHHLRGLIERIQVIQKTDPETGRRVLPNSQLHDLREGLFLGRHEADARVRLIVERYPALSTLLEGEAKDSSLFRAGESENGQSCYETRFLDALESAAFWEGGHRA